MSDAKLESVEEKLEQNSELAITLFEKKIKRNQILVNVI